MKIWQHGNISKVILVGLVVALVLSVALSANYLISSHRTLDKYTYEGQNPVEVQIDRVIDAVVVAQIISEFRTRNDGAHPSLEYITATLGADYPLHLEKIEIKGETHDPSSTTWPAFKTLHVWPGYACTDGAAGRRFTADEIEYGDTLERNDAKFALIGADVVGVLIDPESAAPIKKESDRNPTYSCGDQ